MTEDNPRGVDDKSLKFFASFFAAILLLVANHPNSLFVAFQFKTAHGIFNSRTSEISTAKSETHFDTMQANTF